MWKPDVDAACSTLTHFKATVQPSNREPDSLTHESKPITVGLGDAQDILGET